MVAPSLDRRQRTPHNRHSRLQLLLPSALSLPLILQLNTSHHRAPTTQQPKLLPRNLRRVLHRLSPHRHLQILVHLHRLHPRLQKTLRQALLHYPPYPAAMDGHRPLRENLKPLHSRLQRRRCALIRRHWIRSKQRLPSSRRNCRRVSSPPLPTTFRPH